MSVFRWPFAVVCSLVLLSCGGTVRPGGRETGDGGPENGGTSGTTGKGGTGGQAGRATGGTGGATKACPSPLTRCGGSCVDTQTNSSHCGACNAACTSGVSCVNGSCQSAPSGCPAGQTFCQIPFSNARCIDLQTNSFACGSCSTPCVNSEECVNGQCIPGTCFPGLTLCAAVDGSSRCADLSVDRNNCGACNNQCGPAESCQQGKCIPPDCGFPYVYCRETGCVDATSDVANCGKCGNSCAGGTLFDYSAYSCTNGTCGCAPLANICGSGCASQFWYCPGPPTSTPADVLCMQTARNAYQRCACKNCLAEVTSCSTDPSCVNAMDCSLPNVCIGCDQTFTPCTDGQGQPNPLAEKLIACMNSTCKTP
jgi:hypothetical protein